MFDFENMLAITFRERVRDIQQKDLEAYSKRMKPMNKIFPSIYLDIKGCARPANQKELAQDQMSMETSFVNKPKTQSVIVYLHPKTEIPDGHWNQYAYFIDNPDISAELLGAVDAQDNWIEFTAKDDGLDRERMFVNFNVASGAEGSERHTDFSIKPEQATFSPIPQAYLELPFETVKAQLRSHGVKFETGKNAWGRPSISFTPREFN